MRSATILLVDINNTSLIGQLTSAGYVMIMAGSREEILGIDNHFDLMIISQRQVGKLTAGDIERLYFMNNSTPIAVLIDTPDAIEPELLTVLQRGTFECINSWEVNHQLTGKRIDTMVLSAQFDKNLRLLQSDLGEKESLEKEIAFRDQVLQNLQQINANILASITSGLIILDTRATVMLANQSAAQLLGFEATAIIGTAAPTALPVPILALWEAFQKSSTPADAGPVIEKCRINDKVISVTLYWILNYTSQRAGVLILFNDITELENINIQLYRAEKLATVGTMLSGIAHELRNPISIISARSQRGLAREAYDDDWVRKNFESIDKQAQRCASIVNNLLDYTRHTATKTGYHKAAEVIEESLTYVSYQNCFDTIAVVKTFEPDLIIFGDRSRFVQIFVNLITNAAQAMGGNGTLTLTTSRESNARTLISIGDTGPGIDPAIAERIFDPFFTTKEPGQGNGLGLAIVHKIVQESGGSIRFTSQPNATTFFLTLPAVRQ